MQQDKDAEIKALKAEIKALKADLKAKDAVIMNKDADLKAKDAEIMESLDFSIQAVTTAVTLLNANGRCDLADSLMPILNQLKLYHHSNIFQVAHQLYRPQCVETNTAEVEDISIAWSHRAGKASNRASRAMVQTSTQGSSGSGGKCFKGGRYKDLVHAVLDLHLQVALLT